jgi:hypothetical protein
MPRRVCGYRSHGTTLDRSVCGLYTGLAANRLLGVDYPVDEALGPWGLGFVGIYVWGMSVPLQLGNE